MALLWFDGFECYENQADMTVVRDGNFIEGYTFASISFNATEGRRGSRCLYTRHSNYVEYILASNYTTLILGIATRQSAAGSPGYVAGWPWLGFYDDTTMQIGLFQIGEEYHLYRGATKIDESSGAGLIYNVWKYTEIKFTIDNSSGAVEVRTDGGTSSMIDFSGDTQETANAYINRIRIAGPTNIYNYSDDLYICDTTGSKNNNFLGDVRADPLYVSGAGSHTDFTPSAGSNYENTDDDPYPDDDSTYNTGDAIAEQDSYAMDDLPAPSSVTIHGVKSQVTMRKTDAGARGAKLLTRSGGSDYLSDELLLSESYLTKAKIYEDNPNDAAAWEDADVNGMEVGMEITT